jgi:hypothetical protein
MPEELVCSEFDHTTGSRTSGAATPTQATTRHYLSGTAAASSTYYYVLPRCGAVGL